MDPLERGLNPLEPPLEGACTFACRVQATSIAPCPVFKPCCCFYPLSPVAWCWMWVLSPPLQPAQLVPRSDLCPGGPAAVPAEMHVVLHQDGGKLRAFLSTSETLGSWRALLAIHSPNLVQPLRVLLSMNHRAQARWHQLGTGTATSGLGDLPLANHGVLGVPSQAPPFPGMS